MGTETVSVSQQLEALLHEWRGFPHLISAVSSAKRILEHPEDFVRQDIEFSRDVIPLTEETGNGSRPLSAITYLYDISSPQQETPASRQKVFLQVHFKLCNSISPPNPEDFDQHISIIHASVDDKGEVLPATAEQWELKVRKGFRSTKLELQKEIDQLTNPTSSVEPYRTTFYAWAGNQVNILPKSK